MGEAPIFPTYFTGLHTNESEQFTKDCIEVFTSNFSEDDTQYKYDKNIILESFQMANALCTMDVLAIAFNFNEIAFSIDTNFSVDFALRLLFANGFFIGKSTQIPTEAIHSSRIAIEKVISIYDDNKNYQQLYLSAISYNITNLAHLYSIYNITLPDNLDFIKIVEIIRNFYNNYAKTDKQFVYTYIMFCIESLSSINLVEYFDEISIDLFKNICSDILIGTVDGTELLFDHERMNNTIIVILNNSKIPHEIRMQVFILLSRISSTNQNAAQFFSVSPQIDIICNFIGSIICEQHIDSSDIVFSEAIDIKRFTEPLLKEDQIIDIETFTNDVLFPKSFSHQSPIKIPTIKAFESNITLSTILQTSMFFFSSTTSFSVCQALQAIASQMQCLSFEFLTFAAMLIRLQISKDSKFVAEDLSGSSIFDILATFGMRINNEGITHTIFDGYEIIYQESLDNEFLKKLFTCLETNIVSLVCNEVAFNSVLSCLMMKPELSVPALKVVAFDQRIANMIVLMQNVHSKAVQEGNEFVASHAERARYLTLQLVSTILSNQLYKDYMINSEFFIIALTQLALERPLTKVGMGFLGVVIASIGNGRIADQIFTFFSKVMSKINNIKYEKIARSILSTITTCFKANKAVLADKILTSNMIDDFVSLVEKTNDINAMDSLLDLTEMCASMRGVLREHLDEIDVYAKILPVVKSINEIHGGDEMFTHMWHIVFEGKLDPDVIHPINNAAPLSLFMYLYEEDESKLLWFLDYISQCVEADQQSALEVNNSDLPSHLMRLITGFRGSTEGSPLLDALIRLFSYLSSYSMKSRDMLALFQNFTLLPGNYKPTFTPELLRCLLLIFQTPYDSPSSFFHMTGGLTSMKLPVIENVYVINEFTLFFDIELIENSNEPKVLFSCRTTGGQSLTFWMTGQLLSFEIKDRDKMTGVFEYPFSIKTWTQIAITFDLGKLRLYVHGKEQGALNVPRFSLTGNIIDAVAAVDLGCNISHFGFLRAALNQHLIKLLASFPRSQVTTYSLAELSTMPAEFCELAHGMIKGTAIYLFQACITRGNNPINLAESVQTDNLMELQGQIVGYSPLPKDTLSTIGGPSAIVPLFALLDQIQKPKEGEEPVYKFDSGLLPFLLQILIAFIRGSYNNQVAFYESGCLETIAALIERSKVEHISLQVVGLIKRLLDEVIYDPLVFAVIKSLLLNFSLWIYSDVEVPIAAVNFVHNYLMRPGITQNHMLRLFSIEKLLFIIRIYLWSSSYDSSKNVLNKERIDPVTNEIINRPSDEALEKVRNKMWYLIEEIAMKKLEPYDVQMIVSFSLDITDVNITREALIFIARQFNKPNRNFIRYFKKLYTFKTFFPLFIADDDRVHAQLINLFMFFNSLDKKERDEILEPCTFEEWITGIMSTLNITKSGPYLANSIYIFLFKIPQQNFTRFLPTYNLPATAQLQFNYVQMLPLALMITAELNDADAYTYVSALERTTMDYHMEVLSMKSWDIPFILYLTRKIPCDVKRTNIGHPTQCILRLLAELYRVDLAKKTLAKNLDECLLDKLSFTCSVYMQRTKYDFSHIIRIILIEFLEHMVDPVHPYPVSAQCQAFRIVFEYLFLIPDSCKYFLPFSAVDNRVPYSFKELLCSSLDNNTPKISYSYGTRTTDKMIWEDAELADKLLGAIAAEPSLFNTKNNTVKDVINPFMIYAFTLGHGISHSVQFALFTRHIRPLTSRLPPNVDPNDAQINGFIAYMGGLIRAYMTTEKSHESHIYMMEDSNSLARIIYRITKEKIRWGKSIDSFDACFKQNTYNFAHMILEKYQKIEQKVSEYAKEVEKASSKIITKLNASGVNHKRNFKEFNEISSSSSLASTSKIIQLEMNQFGSTIRASSYQNIKQYNRLLMKLSQERGPWCSPEFIQENHYKLSNTIQHSNRRGLLTRISKFDDHQDASLRRDRESEESMNMILKNRVVTFNKNAAIITIDTDDQGEAAIAKRKEVEFVILKLEAKLVTMKKLYSGHITLTSTKLCFDAEDSPKFVKIPLKLIHEILFRRYLLMDTAIEIFTSDFKAYFFDFVEGQRYPLLTAIAKMKLPNIKRMQTHETDARAWISEAASKWQNGYISNFDYLMLVNKYAGRSYNDMCQYPIFPWVLQDYTSPVLDLNDPNVYRDLSVPIAAYGKERLEQALERMNTCDSADLRFMYSALYSNPAVVIGFLIRMEPFTSLHIDLQTQKFDNPDRLFTSIPRTWESVNNIPMDFRELIPEFFYLPDFLLNTNKFDLGVLSTGVRVDDVELPPWASSAQDFINKNRAALESKYVSSMLPKWIDMIFGITSRGEASIPINNMFNPRFFEECLTPQIRNNPEELRMVQEYIACFGHGAHQLFVEPHPSRFVMPKQMSPQISNMGVFFHEDSKSPILSISSNSKFLTAFSASPSLLQYNLENFELKRTEVITFTKPNSEETPKITKTFASNHDYAVIATPWDNSFTVARIKGLISPLHIVRNHTKRVTAVAVARHYFITGSADCTAIVWQNALEEVQKPASIIFRHNTPITAVAINDKVGIAVSCSKEGTIVTTALSNMTDTGTICEKIGEPKSVCIVNTGIVLVSFETADKTTVRAYDANMNVLGDLCFDDPLDCMHGFEWVSGDTFIVVATKQHLLKIFATPNLDEVFSSPIDFVVTTIEFCKSINSLVFGTTDGDIIGLPLIE